MLSLIAGRVACYGASDGIHDERRALMRWTQDSRDQGLHTWLKTHLSELILLGSQARKALQIFVQNNDCSGRC